MFATTFKLDTAESIRSLLKYLLDLSQTTSQTDFLNTVEMTADACRLYVERYTHEIENAINHYQTMHDLNHQAQVKKFAIQKLAPLMPILEYSEMEIKITSTAQKAAMGMRDLREIVRMLREMAKFQEWLAELCRVKTLNPELQEARLTKILESFDAKVGLFKTGALEGN